MAIRVAVAVLTTATVLSFFESEAEARVTHAFTGLKIGPSGPSVSGSGNRFQNPESIAVDQSDNDIYILDSAEGGKIYKFGPFGEPVVFSSTGTNVIEGVGAAGSEEAEIAVAPPGAPGGTAGDIYVASYGNGVRVFGAGGESLGSLGAPQSCGVAVDPSGALFLEQFPGTIRKFIPTVNPPDESDFVAASTAALSPSCQIAVDGSEAIYVAGYGADLVQRLEGIADPEVDSLPQGGRSVAIDFTTDDLYVDQESRVFQYDPSGVVIGFFGSARLKGSHGLGVGNDGSVVVDNNEGGATSDVFGPGRLAAPEVVSSRFLEAIEREATIGAEINPMGVPTTVFVEYGTTESYGQRTLNATLGESEDAADVNVVLHGLEPDTVYHARWTAEAEGMVIHGEDLSFRTAPSSQADEACSNHQFRTGASVELPDCRAFELVSPLFKNGDIQTNAQGGGLRTALDQSALDGESITYSSGSAFPGAAASWFSNQYVAKRSETGWENASISPARTQSIVPGVSEYYATLQYKGFSSDLAQSWIASDSAVPLAADATPEVINLYERFGDGSYRSLTTPSLGLGNGSIPGGDPGDVEGGELEGFSANLSNVVFAATYRRATIENSELFDRHDGTVDLVSVLPGGALPEHHPYLGTTGFGGQGRFPVQQGIASLENAISTDGSHIFWTDEFSDSFGTIYVRLDHSRTEQVSGALPAYFRGAAPDGSFSYYEEEGALGQRSEQTLWKFDTESDSRARIAGGVLGVMGMSADGSLLYFASSEALAAGAIEGAPNLYFFDGHNLVYVTSLSESDVRRGVLNRPSDVGLSPVSRTARVSADGRYALFESSLPLTGYDNRDADTQYPDTEVFRYDRLADTLICVSCNPTGARPHGRPYPYPQSVGEYLEPEVRSAAAWIDTALSSFHEPYVMSSSGNRIFFNSFDRLVPKDVNESQDVYEWEDAGVGSCVRAAGCIFLLSGGQADDRSEFVDADPSGHNVFIETSTSLVPEDPGQRDIYDVREGGGFPTSASQISCTGDACQPLEQPPGASSAASTVIRGGGNFARKPKKHRKRRHRSKGRHVRKHSRHPKRVPAGERDHHRHGGTQRSFGLSTAKGSSQEDSR